MCVCLCLSGMHVFTYVYVHGCVCMYTCAHVHAAEGGAELHMVAVEQTRVRKKVGIAYELTRSINTEIRTHTNVHA